MKKSANTVFVPFSVLEKNPQQLPWHLQQMQGTYFAIPLLNPNIKRNLMDDFIIIGIPVPQTK